MVEKYPARGKSIPLEGRHALSFFGDVLRVNVDLNYPTVTAAAKVGAREV